MLPNEWIDEILEYLNQNRDKQCSKEEISMALGIKSLIVEERLAYLQSQLYITFDDEKGYCLHDGFYPLDAQKIKQNIDRSIRPEIECLNCIDSTNDEMKRRAEQGVFDGTLLVAEEQTKGRGRLQRSWISPKYQNIYATSLWRGPFQRSDIVRMSMVAAVAVCEVLRKEYHCDAWIKWPNDILIDFKKCAGILCEAQTKMQQIEFILVGIGLNVNIADMPEELDQLATSIYKVTGQKQDRNKMIASIYNTFHVLLSEYQQTNQFSFIWKLYQSMSLVLERTVKIIENNQIYDGVVESIDEDGVLLLSMNDNQQKRFISGDVSLRI